MDDQLFQGDDRPRASRVRPLIAIVVAAAVGLGGWSVLHRSNDSTPPTGVPSPTASAADTSSPTPDPTAFAELTGDQITTPTGVQLIVGRAPLRLVDVDAATSSPIGGFDSPSTLAEHTIIRTPGGVIIYPSSDCKDQGTSACPYRFLPDGATAAWDLPAGHYARSARVDSLFRVSFGADRDSVQRVDLHGVAVGAEILLPPRTQLTAEVGGGLLLQRLDDAGQLTDQVLWDPAKPTAEGRPFPFVVAWSTTLVAWVDVTTGAAGDMTISAGTPLHLMDPATGAETIATGPPNGTSGYFDMTFSPSGRYLVAIVTRRNLTNAWVLDLSTRSWSQVPGMPLAVDGQLLTTWSPADKFVLAVGHREGGTTIAVWTPGARRLSLATIPLDAPVDAIVAR